MINDEISGLRRAIASLAARKNVRRYPADLRARLVALVEAHSESSVAALAAALDMPAQTLSRFVSSASPTFVPIQIAPNHQWRASPIIVRGPGGIVVEGLDLDGVADLIRALS